MNVETWPIDRVKPYPNNPRRNDDAVEKVANSIKEFGWQQPIVVDKDGVVIVGHTRLKAAQSLGLEEVPVTVAEGLTENQVQAYRLADNKTGELADWDFAKLELELEEIDWLDVNMDDFGFNEDLPSIFETLENEEIIGSNSDVQADEFSMTLVLPIGAKGQVESFIKEFGKDRFVTLVLQEVGYGY